MRSIDDDAVRRQCLALIDRHFRDPRCGPDRLARSLHVSRRQLDRVFDGGPSATEIIARRRLRAVVSLAAAHPSIPMSEITRRCGYGSYETFRAHCHRFLGCSPRAARAQVPRAA
ncbi:helix-turn-helix domain-containing protein [Microbacterium sp. NPDC089695]|uniref:helix-turn-helix domain-containing protein n=1 Tax=Microbacterium sp. NPDC089695 TaxID=3364198 RepID=UPI00382D5496